MSDAYSDLLLRIFPYETEHHHYPVEAELDDDRRFSRTVLRLDQACLARLLPFWIKGMYKSRLH